MHASTHCVGTIPSHIDLLNRIFNGVDRMSARLDNVGKLRKPDDKDFIYPKTVPGNSS